VPFHFHLLTLFPGYFESCLNTSILARGAKAGLVRFSTHDIRAHALDKHRSTDDEPFGGGGGMVMKPEPLVRCIEAVRHAEGHVPMFLLSASGPRFDQAAAVRLASLGRLGLICGHYEGIDERVLGYVDGELSLGDFVLTGGEPAAAVIVDAVSRLLPGVLGNAESPLYDSFAGEGLVEHPHYTRPAEFRGHSVPPVLLSGNHTLIKAWRRAQALLRTQQRRPAQFAELQLGPVDQRLLDAAAESDPERFGQAIRPPRRKRQRPRAGTHLEPEAPKVTEDPRSDGFNVQGEVPRQ
jgi:tRNA (guanine37-N1)-methyltransferase